VTKSFSEKEAVSSLLMNISVCLVRRSRTDLAVVSPLLFGH